MILRMTDFKASVIKQQLKIIEGPLDADGVRQQRRPNDFIASGGNAEFFAWCNWCDVFLRLAFRTTYIAEDGGVYHSGHGLASCSPGHSLLTRLCYCSALS